MAEVGYWKSQVRDNPLSLVEATYDVEILSSLSSCDYDFPQSANAIDLVKWERRNLRCDRWEVWVNKDSSSEVSSCFPNAIWASHVVYHFLVYAIDAFRR